MTSFDRMNAASNDLLNVGFTHSQPWKVHVQHTDKALAFSQMALPLSSDSISATTSIKRMGSWGFLEGKFNSNSYGMTLSCKVPHMTGASLVANYLQKVDTSSKSDTVADASFECTLPKMVRDDTKQLSLMTPHLKMTYSPMKQAWSVATTSGLNYTQSGSILFGAKANGMMKGSHVDYSMGACLTQLEQGKIFTLSVLAHPYEGIPFSKFVSSIHFKNLGTSRLSQLGAELTHCPNKDKSTDFSVAAQLALGDELAKSIHDTTLKAKINKDANLALALTHKLSEKISATFGIEMKGGKPETIKHGLAFKITP